MFLAQTETHLVRNHTSSHRFVCTKIQVIVYLLESHCIPIGKTKNKINGRIHLVRRRTSSHRFVSISPAHGGGVIDIIIY
jgi:hypothetical protein